MIRNSIGGEVKLIPLDELLAKFDKAYHRPIRDLLDQEHVQGIVVFENLQMDSSQFGNRGAVIYGTTCTYKTVEECAAGRLGDVPSRFAYPVAYVAK